MSASPVSVSELSAAMLRAMLRGDRVGCVDVAKACLDLAMPLKEIYQRVLEPPLYRVGELWECNRLSVASEHLATAIAEAILNQLFMRFSPARPLDRRAVVSCVEGESHQVGARMVSDLLEERGWDCRFLGANTPTAELVRFVGETEPDLVGLSLSVYFHMNDLIRAVEALRAASPELEIIVGGQALRHGRGAVDRLGPRVHAAASLDELERWVATRLEP